MSLPMNPQQTELMNTPIPIRTACAPQRRVTSSFTRLALAATLLLLFAAIGEAGTITVLNNADSGPNSLR
jgi:hypothetical protein